MVLNDCYNVLSNAIYTIFREIYEHTGSEPDRFFALDRREARRIVSARTQLSLGSLETELDRKEAVLEHLSHDVLVQGWPQAASSLMSVIHAAESAGTGLRDAVENADE